MDKNALRRGLAKERTLFQTLGLTPKQVRERARAGAATEAATLADVETFCMFIGYPRSGHSLVGSLLDAHPDIVIAHELDALQYFKAGLSIAEIYYLLLDNARLYAELGRRWGEYEYAVPNQWQGRFRRLRVIGDKKGGASTMHLARDSRLLDLVLTRVPQRKRFIHVLRNPFDNIATLSLKHPGGAVKAAEDYFQLHATNCRIMDRMSREDIVNLYHEDIVASPRRTLSDLVARFGLSADPDYLEDCASIVFAAPHRSRDKVEWPVGLVAEIEAQLRAAPLLARYSFAD